MYYTICKIILTTTHNLNQYQTDVLVELIEIILKKDVFEFDNKYYLQIQGTAMGTKMAPAYAYPFMSR